MKRKSLSKISMKQLLNALRDVNYDLDELHETTGISTETLAELLSIHGADEGYLAVCAAADRQAMSRAHAMRDDALEALQSVLRDADDAKQLVAASKAILDYHTALTERVQLPAIAARVERAMGEAGPSFGFGGEQ